MADPGEGLRGLATPPLGSFQTFLATHVYPFFIPKIIVWVIIWVSVQEDCSCSSSWLLNHPNARSIFDEDLHARNLLGLLQSIIVYQALQLDDEVEGMLFTSVRKTFHFPNPLEMRYLDGKHSGSQQIGGLRWRCFPKHLWSFRHCLHPTDHKRWSWAIIFTGEINQDLL